MTPAFTAISDTGWIVISFTVIVIVAFIAIAYVVTKDGKKT